MHGTISTLFLLICYTAKHQGCSDKDMKQDIQGLIECLADLPWKFDVLLCTVALHYTYLSWIPANLSELNAPCPVFLSLQIHIY